MAERTSKMPQVMTGARAVFKINNVAVAFATNVNYRVSIPHAPVAVLGRYSVAGHEPLGYDVSFSCGTVRIPGKSPHKAKIQPLLQDLMTFESFTVEVYDRATDQNVVSITDVRLVDRAGGIGARDINNESWDFVGVIFDDEYSLDNDPNQEGTGATQPFASNE